MYIVYVSTKVGKNPSASIESAIKDLEWARLRGGDAYLVFGETSPKDLRDLIRPLLGDSGHILVIEVNAKNRSGFLATSTVDWIKKHAP